MKKSFYIKSNCDGLNLYVSIFYPKEKEKGIIQFAHGMLEHQTYYYDMMKYFSEKGYICVIADHRGHGKSIKNQSDLGYFYEKNAEYIVEDFHQITNYIKNEYPSLPIYLYGYSMGSLVVLKYLKKYNKDISKVIICGLPSKDKKANIGLFIMNTYKLFRGERYRSNFLNNLVLTSKSSSEWLSNNKEYIKEYTNDSNCNYIFTINGFLNLVKLFTDTYNKNKWNIKNKDLSIYILAGDSDIVVGNEKNLLKSIHFMKKMGLKNIKYKIYDNCKHAIFKDKTEEFYKDILTFIEKG